MDFQSLVGKIFHEKELYEILLFEIETNFEQYFSKAVHFYFDRMADQKIRVTEVFYFSDADKMDKISRTIIEKKEWFEFYEHHGHVDLRLVRFDRMGWLSIVWSKDETLTHESGLAWADEYPDEGPMSPEEKREAFQELAGHFEDSMELQKLRSKKAV